MYSRYFGLTEKPFAIAPNPKYLYMSELHREALAHLLYGINGEGCIILLTGEVGTGKTTICRCLLQQLPDTTDVALILNPKMSILDLLKTICEELHIALVEDSTSIKFYIDKLNNHLLATHSKGRSTVLIIDEAQNLDLDVLEQLRLLTNLETDTHKLLQIVLIGQPELRTSLSHPELRQINQRITTRYHLAPLTPKDVETYIRHRMVVGGLPENFSLFSSAAVRYITQSSKGIPRLINIVCDRALLGAYAENRDRVTRSVVKKAVREVVAPKHNLQRTPNRGILFAIVVLGVLLFSSSTIYLFTYGADMTPMVTKYRELLGKSDTTKIPLQHLQEDGDTGQEPHPKE